MANLNKVMLIGNLTRDPELRVTPKGTAICTFSLAVNRKFRDESGADREEVTYVDIEAWGKAGENISKYCTKGRPLSSKAVSSSTLGTTRRPARSAAR